MLSRKRRTADPPPVDAELYERVRAILHEELDELIAIGRVALDERGMNSQESEDDFAAELKMTPTRPGTTGIHMDVYDDTITFGTGGAGAHNEIWSVTRGWDFLVRQMVRCVRDGRYSERVRSGWVFPLKVDMRFGGVRFGRRRGRQKDYVVRYAFTLASVDGTVSMPPTGEFEYEPW